MGDWFKKFFPVALVLTLFFGFIIWGLGLVNFLLGIAVIGIFVLGYFVPRWVLGLIGAGVGGVFFWYLTEDVSSAVFGTVFGCAIFFILGAQGLEFAAGIFMGGAGSGKGSGGFGGGESGGGGAGRGF